MAVNQMQITDVYQILNSLHTQATGKQSLAPTNTGEFVSMATTTLAVGTDVVYNQLMNTIAKTVFSSRPYNMKFKGLIADQLRWGGIIRKISMADKDSIEDKAFHGIVDGQAVDHYIVNKADILEMRFFGSDVYQDMYTIFQDQLVNAFNSAEQLGSFIAMVTQEMSNKWEQYLEELSRGALANFIGAKVSANNSVVHLLTEYNHATSQSLTVQDIWKPTNVKPFFEWVKGYIDTLSRRMTERSGLYQVQVANKHINRHTPYDKQKVYLTSDYLDIINTTVLTEAFHNEELSYRDVVGVSYWQSIDAPTSISVTPSVVDASGVVTVAEEPVDVENLFGVIFDEDAIAINVIDNIVVNTPMNARGLYYNTWLTSHTRYTNDLTEKGIVLLLD